MTTPNEDLTLLPKFRAIAHHLPEAPLVHYFGSTLTAGEVDEMSDALAAALVAGGFGPGQRLALYLQNIPQYMIALLAAWKAGGIAVSVNPMYRHREVRWILVDSGATAAICMESLWSEVLSDVWSDTPLASIITTSELDFVTNPDRVPILAASRRQRAGDWPDLLETIERYRDEAVPVSNPAPHDVACLVYTSGTTGPAKGAMNTHGNVAFSANTYCRTLELTEQDVVLGVAPLFHITGLTAHLAVAMQLGVPVVLSFRFDPAQVLELIEQQRTTFTVASITVFQALMNHPDAQHRDVSSLRTVYSGGQAVAAATVDAYERQMGPYIRIAYGLTETTGPTHLVPVDQRAPIDPITGTLSAGQPVFGTRCQIIADDGSERAVGAIGEVTVSGPQVIPGYWRNEGETEHAFKDGWFHTGDVGFVDADGWLYLVDRMKDLINASGYKIWPREVEDVLYEHPSVREAAVVGVVDSYRGETVKAFVSLRRDQQVTEAELIRHCRARLAAFKVPRTIVILPDLPQTATGKILRRELREHGS